MPFKPFIHFNSVSESWNQSRRCQTKQWHLNSSKQPLWADVIFTCETPEYQSKDPFMPVIHSPSGKDDSMEWWSGGNFPLKGFCLFRISAPKVSIPSRCERLALCGPNDFWAPSKGSRPVEFRLSPGLVRMLCISAASKASCISSVKHTESNFNTNDTKY